MRRLNLGVDVNAPSDFALAFLNTYFLERGGHPGGAELALRFPVPRFVIEGLTLEKRVRIHLKYEPDGSGGHHLTISWQPLGRGPLPNFDGALTAQPQTAATSRVAIDGAYEPPGGPAGAIFDGLVGVRIARATLAALLDEFKSAIENDYRARSYP